MHINVNLYEATISSSTLQEATKWWLKQKGYAALNIFSATK